MQSATHIFLGRYGQTQSALARNLELSQPQISLFDRGLKPEPRWWKAALAEEGRRLKAEARLRASEEKCPECGAVMKLDVGHLRHWFHGRLKTRLVCRQHPRPVLLGIPWGKEQLRRLDRATNPNTGKEVPLIWRHRKPNSYEIRYGPIWCDATSGRVNGCNWMCLATTRTVQRGRRLHWFKCVNPTCTARPRSFKVRGGKPLLLSPRRRTTLPEGAQQCPHCEGATIKGFMTRQAMLPHVIPVHCKRCGKKAYYSRKTGCWVPPPGLGWGKVDANRPECRKCTAELGPLDYRRKMRRAALTCEGYQKTPLRAPRPVRLKLGPPKEGRPGEILAIQYECRHVEIWIWPDGRLIWIRHRSR
jgi:hypothetical protein